MQIQSSEDYEIFRPHPKNRVIKEYHVQKMMDSIMKSNKLDKNPILVDKLFRVYDGQHRLEACRRLKIPVMYILDDRLQDEDMILLNEASMRWGNEDFLKYYLESGHTELQKAYNLAKELDVPLLWMVAFLTGSRIRTEKGKQFREFKMPDKLRIENIVKIVIYIKEIQKILQESNPKIAKQIVGIRFTHGLYSFLSRKDVDPAAFRKKFDFKPDLIRLSSTKEGYLDQFVDLYNWHNKNPIPNRIR